MVIVIAYLVYSALSFSDKSQLVSIVSCVKARAEAHPARSELGRAHEALCLTAMCSVRSPLAVDGLDKQADAALGNRQAADLAHHKQHRVGQYLESVVDPSGGLGFLQRVD